MEKQDKIYYYSYIIIGVLYILVKVIFVAAGYLQISAIAHGAIVAVPITLVSILSLIERKNSSRKIWHIFLIILPILAFIITPIYMYFKMGSEQWLTEGRLAVLIIYEVFSAVQLLFSIILIRRKSMDIRKDS